MAGLFAFTREKTEERVLQISVEEIQPNRHQPRVRFPLGELRVLADSIRQNGILQPLCVRKVGEQYELIAGERRLRAAKLAGLTTVPCIVMEINDRNSAILALVENIQREDLNCFEEAAALEKLISFYGMTQEDTAMRLGRAQSTIANKLRLLRLSEEERCFILEHGLTERHARTLLRLSTAEERKKVLDKIVRLGLNVDKTERYIDTMLERKQEQESLKKRSVLFRDVRLFVNTINKAVETMQVAGIEAEVKKQQFPDRIEYRILIPLQIEETGNVSHETIP
ncbi:MAG: ParB/RepB/Spo0J family partition protein [Oscillospiraceae bacterium]|nr:ParB/RepB/Spo0J family partition protein [Oscillospiraceae bacterium]